MALSRVKVWGNEILTPTDLNAEIDNIINNASSLISPLSGSLDWDGYAHTLDAAGVTTAQSTTGIGWSFNPGSKSGTPATTGATSNWAAHTFTDSATAGSGTASAWTGHSFQRPTLAATNASVTTTNASTLYVANAPLAGTNETITNPWALWIDDGSVRMDADLHIHADLVATINKYSLTTSVGSNALTIALKDRDGNDASASTPLTFKFRSTTGGTGTFTLGSVTGALSTVVSNGSTLGTASNVAHRIHVGALLTGSTVELCYWNSQTITGLVTFQESELVTTTAEGGAGGADSAGTMYSTTSRASVPWVYLGYIETTQGTAGAWASNASKVQTAFESSLRPGQVLQVAFSQTSSVATGTTQMVVDDTIPQNTEGDQYMTLGIVPFNACNQLRIIASIGVCNSTVGNSTAMALFQDTTANALAVTWSNQPTAVQPIPPPPIAYRMLAGTTSSTTFKLRAGSSAAGTFTFNGSGGARLFGGVANSYMMIEEIFS